MANDGGTPPAAAAKQERSWGASRWWVRSAVLFVLIGLVSAAAVWLSANPTLMAYLCPSCFGFEPAGTRVFVEAKLSRAERNQLTTDLAEARKRVAAMYGSAEADPVWLVCASEECDRRIGGKGARAVTYGWHIVRVSPRGRTPVVLAHELSHAELHQRIGWWALATGSYPAWFDEGLAVLVSRDSRVLDLSRVSAPRCRVVMTDADVKRLPRNSWDWADEMWRTRDLYERAACVVARWYQTAGRKGVLALIEDLRSGQDFAAAFAARGKR